MPPLTRDVAAERLRAAIDVYRSLEATCADDLSAAADAIVAAYRDGGKLIAFGNGGSAADAQHIAAEFVGRFELERPSLPALALTVNGSALTAIANDYGYESVFARQLEGLGDPGDVALGLSTSGGSPNVLAALRAARAKGMATVGLSGGTGGEMRSVCDHCIVVPSDQTPRIQEGHILMAHILCEVVERSLFPGA